MPPQATITIVGLERVGASIGLALRKPEFNLQVIGHDSDPTVAAKAAKLGAVEKTHWNLVTACEGADLVILATSLDEIRRTLPAIAPALRDNCVVTDTARLKTPVMQWAKDSLPSRVYFVGGDPMLNAAAIMETDQSVEAARPDLFSQAPYCIIPSTDCPPEAIKLISDIVQLLGAEPFYMDAYEHDALVSGIESLPLLLHLALVRSVTKTTGWRDARRLAGRSFALSTALIEGDATSHGASLTLNREPLLRWIDALGAELAELREVIHTVDDATLQQALEQADTERATWLRDLAKARWEDVPKTTDMPSANQRLAQLLGFGLFSRKSKNTPDPGSEKKKKADR